MENKKGIARIICAGEKSAGFVRKQGDLVIAADGGLNYANEWGVLPDIVIGDFDSLGYKPECGEVITLPVEKDDTDTLAAIKIAENRGYTEFFLYSAAGGECDHTIANVCVLNMLAKKGKHAYMYNGDRIMTVICNESLVFNADCRGKISVFACGDSAKVKIKGLKYEFNGVMTSDFPLGCGNVFIGKTGQIYSEKSAIVVFPAEIYNNELFTRCANEI